MSLGPGSGLPLNNPSAGLGEAQLLSCRALPAHYRREIETLAEGLPTAWTAHTDRLLEMHRHLRPDCYPSLHDPDRPWHRRLSVFARAYLHYKLDSRAAHPMSDAETLLHQLASEVHTDFANNPVSPELRAVYRTLNELRDALCGVVALRRTALHEGWTDERRQEFERHCTVLRQVLGGTHPFVMLLERVCPREKAAAEERNCEGRHNSDDTTC